MIPAGCRADECRAPRRTQALREVSTSRSPSWDYDNRPLRQVLWYSTLYAMWINTFSYLLFRSARCQCNGNDATFGTYTFHRNLTNWRRTLIAVSVISVSYVYLMNWPSALKRMHSHLELNDHLIHSSSVGSKIITHVRCVKASSLTPI